MSEQLKALRELHLGRRETDDHAALLLSVAEEAVETRRGLSMRGVGGAPDWAGYETALWDISEDLRAYLRGKRRLRGQCPLFDAVAQIVSDPRYGKGRENFVLVLGQFGGAAYTDTIAAGLGDPDVAAHALSALRRLKDDRFLPEAKAIAADPPSGAARLEARKYLKVFG